MPTDPPYRPRVLVIRCCRTPRLLEAAQLVRRRFATAEIVVLCHASAATEVIDKGLPDVVTYDAPRMGPFAAADALLRLRKAGRFDLVVLPFMTPDDSGYANVVRMAVAIDAAETVILRGHEAEAYGRSGLRRLARRVSMRACARWFDVPLLLAAVATASLLTLLASWYRRRATKGDGRLRVLHVVTGLGTGGAKVQIGELVARTPLDRYAVDVLVLAPYEGAFSLAAAGWSDVRVRVFDSWPQLTSCLLHVYRLCRRERYDIVHTWRFYANIIGVAAARLAGVPRIITSVRDVSLWRRQWYDRPWFRIADALTSRSADVVTVGAWHLAAAHARWAWYPQRRIQVVVPGLNPDTLVPMRHADRDRLRREFAFATDAKVVGTIGPIARESDHQTFLCIVSRLVKTMPTLQAVILGSGDADAPLRALAHALGIEDRVRFAGDRADARFLMAGFDLLLLTSRRDQTQTLLEAAFLEVPIAAVDAGGARDIVDPAQLFAAGSMLDGARVAARLLNNPAAAQLAAASTRTRALSRFTSARAAAEWLAVYEPTTGEAA